MIECSTVNSIAEAIVAGIVSIPKGLRNGVKRTAEDLGFYGKEVQQENFGEFKRLFSSIASALQTRGPLTTLVGIILADFFDKVPDDAIEKMIQKAIPVTGGYMAGRIATNFALVSLINRKVVDQAIQGAIVKRISKLGVSFAVSIVLFQGFIEEASDASKRLQASHPRLHQELKSRNLDMLFFVVEDQLQPFLDATRLQRNFPSQFDEILERIKTLLDS